MAEYTISKIKLPNGDICNIKDTWRGIQDNLTSSTNTTESLSAKQGYLLANGSARDDTKVEKTTYEYNREISFGSSGLLLIGKFPCYDSNVTIEIRSTTNQTYYAVAILATQNINTTGEGTISWCTYGDTTNSVTANLYAKYVSGSRNIEIYFVPTSWSKNLIHIQAAALRSAPTNICESVTSKPAEATRQPTNTATNANYLISGTLSADRLATSGATAGSYGDSSAQTPGYGSTFKVPYITVDNKGRVTSINDHTVKIPESDGVTSIAGKTGAVTLADLGLSQALRFIGITSTSLSDGATTSTLVAKSSGSLIKTTGFVTGDVVIDTNSAYEYVWTGSAWERLGGDSSYKTTQTAKSDPTASTTTSTTFIDTISQDANGVITATKKTLPSYVPTSAGVTAVTWDSTNKKLTRTINGSAADVVTIGTIKTALGLVKGDVGLGNVENTALSTWAGTNKITTLGTITTGTWQGTAITASYIGNHSTDKLTSGTLPVERGGTGQTSIANIQAGKDGDGNTISSTYLKLSGGDLTGDLGIITGDTNKFLNFWYNTNKIAGASWRLGVLGSGGDDTNYFIIQSGTSGVSATTWNDTIRIGQNTYDVAFGGNIYPLTNNTKTLGTSSYKWSNVYATTFTGNLTGNVTGNVTGSSGSCTGNAATATQLASAGTTNQFYRGDRTWSDTLLGTLKITSNNNTLTIGSQSSSFCNIYNSANIVFMFNNRVCTTAGGLGSGSYPWSELYLRDGIYYTGTKATYRMLRFIDNTGDEYGNGISIGGGGATIIGGGESADVAAAQVSGGSEILYLCNDGDVNIFPNMQDGWDSRKTFTFNTSGNIVPPAGCRIGESGGALYLGNSSNQSWVYIQDMCSQSGSDKWKILANGTANFAGTVTAPTFNGNATNVTGTVAVGHGGTGATNATDARTNLQVPQVSPGTNDVQIAFFSFKGRDGNWYDLIIYNGASYKIGLNKHGVGLVWRF